MRLYLTITTRVAATAEVLSKRFRLMRAYTLLPYRPFIPAIITNIERRSRLRAKRTIAMMMSLLWRQLKLPTGLEMRAAAMPPSLI